MNQPHYRAPFRFSFSWPFSFRFLNLILFRKLEINPLFIKRKLLFNTSFGLKSHHFPSLNFPSLSSWDPTAYKNRTSSLLSKSDIAKSTFFHLFSLKKARAVQGFSDELAADFSKLLFFGTPQECLARRGVRSAIKNAWLKNNNNEHYTFSVMTRYY